MFDLVLSLDPRAFYAKFFPGINLYDADNVKVVCPFHADTQESLSINLEQEGGLFYCFGCGAKGNLIQFYKQYYGAESIAIAVDQIAEEFGLRPITTKIDPETVHTWHLELLNDVHIKQLLFEERKITEQTMVRFKLGYDITTHRITIPIYAPDGRIINVRKWLPLFYRQVQHVAKCIGVTGNNLAALFPFYSLTAQQIIVCEGEIDCMLLHQHGFNAVTTTGGVHSFNQQWIPYFRNKDVVLILDNDAPGQRAAQDICEQYGKHVASIRNVVLPSFDDVEHPDVSDYFTRIEDATTIITQLIEKADPFVIEVDEAGRVIREVNLLQAGMAKNINKLLRVEARITGKNDAPYAIPAKIAVSCTKMMGKMCAKCPYYEDSVDRDVCTTPIGILNALKSTRAQQQKALSGMLKIPDKCAQSSLEIVEYKNVEELQISPDVSTYDTEFQFVIRTAYLVGGISRINDLYAFEGETVPDPVTSEVVHVFNKATPAQSSIDQFAITAPVVLASGRTVRMCDRLKFFQAEEGGVETRLDKLYTDLEHNITHIIKRRDLLQAVDLTYHSPIRFTYGDQIVNKGWIDTAIIGDTKTGKSETVEQIMRHYRAGEMLNAEQTSRVGITGGYIAMGNKTRFVLGRWPLNDRRLCCIDEFTALTQDEIGELTRMRSTGVCESAKQGQINKFFARVRFIALMNPRNNRQMATYGFGCQAINDALGADADVSRWDIAIAVSSSDVSVQDIHNSWKVSVEHTHTSDLCHDMVTFAWSRRPDQVVFTQEAIKTVTSLVESMAQIYTDEIPLVIGAEFRYKLARFAAAIAIRLFHVDSTMEVVVVDEEHVQVAANFISACYDKDTMGFRAYSMIKRREKVMSKDTEEQLVTFLSAYPIAVIIGLQESNTIMPSSIEVFGNVDSFSARECVSKLYQLGCIRKLSNYYVKTEAFINFLRTYSHTQKR